jgi:hypothetical protein
VFSATTPTARETPNLRHRSTEKNCGDPIVNRALTERMAKRVLQWQQGPTDISVGEPTIQNRNFLPTWLD